MITLYTGRPGSGKSFRVVSELKRLSQKYFIFHNIRGLKHEKFPSSQLRQIDQFLKDQDITLSVFLSLEYQESLCKRIHSEYDLRVLIVLDECYQFVGTTNTDQLKRADVQTWLAQHRHLGQDIFLICQNPDQLYRPIRGLLFERIHAKKGKLLNFFLYDHYEGPQKIGSSKISARKDVFDCYSSFQINSAKVKTSKKLYYMIAACVLSICLCAWGFWSITGGRVAKLKKQPDQVEQKKLSPEEKKNVDQVEAEAQSTKKQTNKPLMPEFSPPDIYRLVAFSKDFVFFCDDSGRVEMISDGIIKIEGKQVLVPYRGEILRLPFNFSKKADCYFNFDGIPAKELFKLFCQIYGFDYNLSTKADFKTDLKVCLKQNEVYDFFINLFTEKGFIPFADRGVWVCAGSSNEHIKDDFSNSTSQNFFTDNKNSEPADNPQP